MSRALDVLDEKIDPKTYMHHTVLHAPVMYMVRYEDKMVSLKQVHAYLNGKQPKYDQRWFLIRSAAFNAADHLNNFFNTKSFSVWQYDGTTSVKIERKDRT